MSETDEPQAVFRAFLDQLTRDQAEGRERSLGEYIQQFPGHDLIIARELLRREQSRGGQQDDSTIGPYTMSEELGRGGQGIVYRARHGELGHDVALKILKGLGPDSGSLIDRFYREARVAARLNHPGICQVIDAGVENGVPFMAMQYVEGETLDKKIAHASEQLEQTENLSFSDTDPSTHRSSDVSSTSSLVGRKEIERTLLIIEKAADALHAAHEAGVVHRDVKPANIMVRSDGEPVLLDFGLAKSDDADLATLTTQGDFLGTPAYMSPEQLAAHRIRLDRRTDVWSLGVALFESLALQRPFKAPSREALYQSIMMEEAPDVRRLNRSVSQDLATVVAKALEKNRDRRYATARALAEDLRRIRTHQPILARRLGPLARSGRWLKRNPTALSIMGAVFSILLAALGITYYWLQEVETVSGKRELDIVEKRNALALAESRLLVGRSRSLLDNDPGTALVAAHEALKIRDSVETRSACLDALQANHEVVRIQAHQGAIDSVTISPCERYALTTSISLYGQPRLTDGDLRARGELLRHDQSIRLISLDEGREDLAIHTESGTDVFFSSDGQRFATLKTSGEVEIWNCSPPQRMSSTRLPAFCPVIDNTHFSPDLQRVTYRTKDLKEVIIATTATGRVARRISNAGTVRASADRTLHAYYSREEGLVRTLDARTLREVHPPRKIFQFDLGPMGLHAAGFPGFGDDRPILNLQTGDKAVVPGSLARNYQELSLTASAQRVVLHELRDADERTAPSHLTYDLQTGEVTARLFLDEERIEATDYLNEIVASTSRRNPGVIALWDLRSGSRIASYGQHDSRITSLAILQSGTVASGDESGQLRVWSTARPEITAHEMGSTEDPATILSPDGATTARITRKDIRLQHKDSHSTYGISWSPANTASMSVSPDGNIAAISYDRVNDIVFVDLPSKRVLSRAAPTSGSYWDLHWLPDSRHVFMTSGSTHQIVDALMGQVQASRDSVAGPLTSLTWKGRPGSLEGLASFGMHLYRVTQAESGWTIKPESGLPGLGAPASHGRSEVDGTIRFFLRTIKSKPFLVKLTIPSGAQVRSWPLPDLEIERAIVLSDGHTAILHTPDATLRLRLDSEASPEPLHACSAHPTGDYAWIMRPDGSLESYHQRAWHGHPRIVLSATPPTLITSPDGQKVALVDDSGDVHIITHSGMSSAAPSRMYGPEPFFLGGLNLARRTQWTYDSKGVFTVDQRNRRVHFMSRFGVSSTVQLQGPAPEAAWRLSVEVPSFGGIVLAAHHHWPLQTTSIHTADGSRRLTIPNISDHWAVLDGSTLLVANITSLTIMDIQSGIRSKPLPHPTVAPRDGDLWQASFFDDGRAIFLNSHDHARVVETSTGETRAVLRTDLLLDLCPRGQHMLCWSRMGDRLVLFSNDEFKVIGSTALSGEEFGWGWRSATFSPDGQHVVIQSSDPRTEARKASLRAIPSLEIEREIGMTTSLTAAQDVVRFSADSRHVLLLGPDQRSITIASTRDDAPFSTITSPVDVIDFHPGNSMDHVLVLDRDHRIHRVSRSKSAQSSVILDLGPEVTRFRTSPDGSLICGATDAGLLRLFDRFSGEALWSHTARPSAPPAADGMTMPLGSTTDSGPPVWRGNMREEFAIDMTQGHVAFRGLRLPINPIPLTETAARRLRTGQGGMRLGELDDHPTTPPLTAAERKGRDLASALTDEWINPTTVVREIWKRDLEARVRDAALAKMVGRPTRYTETRAEVWRLLLGDSSSIQDYERAIKLTKTLPDNHDEFIHGLILLADLDELQSITEKIKSNTLTKIQQTVDFAWQRREIEKAALTGAYLALAHVSRGELTEAKEVAGVVMRVHPEALDQACSRVFERMPFNIRARSSNRTRQTRTDAERWLSMLPAGLQDRSELLTQFLEALYP